MYAVQQIKYAAQQIEYAEYNAVIIAYEVIYSKDMMHATLIYLANKKTA